MKNARQAAQTSLNAIKSSPAATAISLTQAEAAANSAAHTAALHVLTLMKSQTHAPCTEQPIINANYATDKAELRKVCIIAIIMTVNPVMVILQRKPSLPAATKIIAGPAAAKQRPTLPARK